MASPFPVPTKVETEVRLALSEGREWWSPISPSSCPVSHFLTSQAAPGPVGSAVRMLCIVDVQSRAWGGGWGAQTMTTAAGNQDGQCGQEEQTQDPATGPQAGTWRPGPRLDRGSQGTPVPKAGLCFPPSEDMRLD